MTGELIMDRRGADDGVGGRTASSTRAGRAGEPPGPATALTPDRAAVRRNPASERDVQRRHAHGRRTESGSDLVERAFAPLQRCLVLR